MWIVFHKLGLILDGDIVKKVVLDRREKYLSVIRLIPEIGPLKFLVEREVLIAQTEITTTVPLMDNGPEKILVETPLTIGFDLARD